METKTFYERAAGKDFSYSLENISATFI